MDIAVTILMALALLVTAVMVWRLSAQVAELRLDMAEVAANADETHSLVVGLALEDAPEDRPRPVVYGTGIDDTTWTEVRRA